MTTYKKTKTKTNLYVNINSEKNNMGVSIINSYISNNIDETAYNLKKIIIKYIDNDKFNKYEKDFIPFDKSIQGRSGAIIGYMNSNPRYVIKFNYYKNKPNYDNFFNIKKCLHINNNINEVFINNILNQLNMLKLFTLKQVEMIKPYILEIIDSGFSDKGTYIILPRIGYHYNLNNDNNIKYITNLTDVFVFNHYPMLEIAVKKNDYLIIKLYDNFLELMLSKYFIVLKLLQDKLEYINTDLKLNNIFVLKKNNNNNKFKKLKQYGFDIDFQILISDLDKSIYKIKGVKTVINPNKPFLVKLTDLSGYGLIYNINNKCTTNFLKECKGLKYIEYDFLFIIIHILVILHRKYMFPNIKNYLNKTLNLIKKTLKFNNNELEILLNIINNNVFNKDKRVSFYINMIISKLCKKL